MSNERKTGRELITMVLKNAKKPLSVSDIWNIAVEKKYDKLYAGRTDAEQKKRQIGADLIRWYKEENSPLKRYEKGEKGNKHITYFLSEIIQPPHRTGDIDKGKVQYQKGFVFIAMPMDSAQPELEDVLDAIKTAAAELGLNAGRVDELQSNERITDRIIDLIYKAEFVVCDLTLSKQNVYYEAGYAHGVGKIPIYIAKSDTQLEFDLKDYPVIFFQNLKELKNKLLKRLKSLMNK